MFNPIILIHLLIKKAPKTSETFQTLTKEPFISLTETISHASASHVSIEQTVVSGNGCTKAHSPPTVIQALSRIKYFRFLMLSCKQVSLFDCFYLCFRTIKPGAYGTTVGFLQIVRCNIGKKTSTF